MTAGQEDRFSLFLTVEAACQRHQAVWDTDFPAFAQAFAKFQEHVAEIGRLAADQRSAIRGATRQKIRTRRAMEDSARQLGGALAAWAEVNGQQPLAERVYLSRNAWHKLRDTVCLTRASLILKEGRARLADVADYGVTESLLDELAERSDAYRAELAGPRAAINTRKAATAGLTTHIAAASKVLRTRMDRLMPLLAAAHPAFGTDYQNSRILVDSGGRKRSGKG